jgi:glyoxylase-like metal-dependent hydrolase (beta-lactamase superfamily II)
LHVAEVYSDEHLAIELVGPLGPLANNAYLVRPRDGSGVVVVDAPESSEEVVRALSGSAVHAIVLTHSHRDHWAGIGLLRGGKDAPVLISAEEANLERIETLTGHLERLAHGGGIEVGATTLRVLHTPGHTPGSICLLVGGALLTGDTLFPGGPGHSRTPEALHQEIASITRELYMLPDETLVLPGHGPSTTIGQSRAEYAVFASKPHDASLCGDVVWTES